MAIILIDDNDQPIPPAKLTNTSKAGREAATRRVLYVFSKINGVVKSSLIVKVKK